jgi:hypothetical protein
MFSFFKPKNWFNVSFFYQQNQKDFLHIIMHFMYHPFFILFLKRDSREG